MSESETHKMMFIVFAICDQIQNSKLKVCSECTARAEILTILFLHRESHEGSRSEKTCLIPRSRNSEL